MIKLVDILKEIDDARGIWYHGSTATLTKKI